MPKVWLEIEDQVAIEPQKVQEARSADEVFGETESGGALEFEPAAIQVKSEPKRYGAKVIGILSGNRQHLPVRGLVRAHGNNGNNPGGFSPLDNGIEVFYFLKVAVTVN